ncbi:CTD small phosphatase-like protein 2-A isoform X2 [Hyperolius riggenbachi]
MILRSRKIQARTPREPITPKKQRDCGKAFTPKSANKGWRRVQLKSPAASPATLQHDTVTPSNRKNNTQRFYNLRNVYVDGDLDSPHRERSVRVHFQLDESTSENLPENNTDVILFPHPVNLPDDCASPGHTGGNPLPGHQYFSEVPEEENGDNFNIYKFISSAQAASRNQHVGKKDIPLKTRSTPVNTLVVDLQVLVQSSLLMLDDADYTFLTPFQDTHYKVYLKLRPHVEKFLQTLTKLYEIFIYTTAKKEYGEQILEILDPQKTLIRHRLYQEDCICISGTYVKDLNVLRRDLAKTVALETLDYSLPYHLTNRFPVQHWTGNKDDEELLLLLPELEHLTHVDDVRLVISHQFHLNQLDEDS